MIDPAAAGDLIRLAFGDPPSPKGKVYPAGPEYGSIQRIGLVKAMKKIYYNKSLKKKAQELRRESTYHENCL